MLFSIMEPEKYHESESETSAGIQETYERKIWNLNSLVELSLLINSNLNIENILDVVAFTSMGELMSESVCVFLPHKFGEFDFYLENYKGPDSETIIKKNYEIKSSSRLIDYFNEHPEPFCPAQLSDSQLLSDIGLFESLSLVVISPLLIRSELNGILVLGGKIKQETYNEDDLSFIEILSRIAGIALENARLYEEATYDFKTGLLLYKNFLMRAHKELSRCIRFHENFSLIMIDIDHFKKVNDTYGHNQGDIVLENLGKIIRETIRDIDISARFGGEEFVILCPETLADQANVLAERIQDTLRKFDFPGQDFPLKVTASFGITQFIENTDTTLEHVIERADKALYKSKENGRDRITIF